MATKSNLVNYKSISKPSLGGGGSSRLSSYITSLTKKQNAAEDAILDNQYEAGTITPENYLSNLKTRLGRDYLTPLQVVNLQEKMVQVGEKVNDTAVDAQYKTGAITTSQYYEYQKAKLDKMTAVDSPAYQSQATQVQQLKDKAEKEVRAEYRLSENVRISKLPEDSSVTLWNKAKLYETLQNQATLDGDTSQAMAYEATKNNYTSAAKRADINDIITGAKSTVSSMTEGGLGVPTEGAGQTFYNELTGKNEPISTAAPGGASAGGITQTPVGVAQSNATGVGAISSNYTVSPAVKNAYESLDRSQKTLDRLYNDLKQKQYLITKYDEAISKSSGEQKTQLVTARNNLSDSMGQTQNSIEITTQGVNDTVVRIQELQQKAQETGFNQEVRKTNMAFDKKESDIETEFSKGNINKDEYIQLALGLAKTKADYFGQASDVFNQFGNDISAENYMKKSSDIIFVGENLVNVQNNLGDYEPIAVDPGGKITNIFGKALRPGEFALTNVRQEKDSGTFDMNYVNRGGGYYKVYFPNVKDDMGLPISASLAKELGKLNEQAFIYTNKGGKQVTEPITFVTFTDEKGNPTSVKPVTSGIVENLKKKGIIVPSLGKNSDTNYTASSSQVQFNPDGSVNFSIPPVQQTASDKLYKNITGTLDSLGKNMPQVGKTTIDPKTGQKVWMPFQGFSPGFLETPIKKGQELLKNVGTGITDFLTGKYGVTETDPKTGQKIYMPFKKKSEEQTSSGSNPFDFVTQAVQKLFPTVQAKEISGKAPIIQGKNTQGQIDKVISSLPENQRTAGTLIAQALKEQGILDPNTLAYALATTQHETAGTFQPIDEYGGRQQAEALGYGGGADYFGRGYIQLTHLDNYQKYGDQLGVDLVNNPELANDPQTAARILALYFKDRGTASLASKGDFVGARGTINPDDKGQMIANYANMYLKNQPLIKSLITYTGLKKNTIASPNKNISKPVLEKRSIIQKIGDLIVKPVSGQTTNKISTPKTFVPQISTNTGVKTMSTANKSTPAPRVSSPSTQSFNPQISTNQGVKSYSPSPTPSYSAPKVSTPVYQTKAPTYSTPKPTPVPTPSPRPSTPAPAPKQNIVQKAVSAVSSWINKLKWW